LNDACVLTGKPFVYAAIYQYEGQVSVLNVLNEDGTRSPNYRDLFPGVNAAQIPSCAEGGVIPTIAGIIGCVQANEVIKWITGADGLLAGKILMLDSRTLQSRIIKTGTTSKTTITELTETQHVNLVSAIDLKNHIDNDLYELVDVRNADERKNDDIGGKHVPLSEIGSNFSLIDFDKQVIFYCETGRRSAEAAKIANRRFPDKDFFSLDGGLKAWREIRTKTFENI
jgi:rhodanese-related sulfurtransferase